MKYNILSTINLEYCKKELKELKKLSNITYIINPKKRIDDKIRNIDIYISGAGTKVDKQFIRNAKKLKAIFSPSTGTDHLDLKEIKKKKIKLFHIAKERKLLDGFTATSELTFGLLLALNRKLIPAYKESAKGSWPREKFIGKQLYKKTFGILGYGRLGKISSNIARGFGMKVIANDIKKIKTKNVDMVSIKNLFKKSDFISIHIHLNNKTEGLVNKKLLQLMKKTAMLINTSRGKIINEKDLLYFLKNKKIGGAALDIINGEWLSKKKLKIHKLIIHQKKNDNLIIVPHLGGSTFESIYGAREHICKILISKLKKGLF
jgi:phosphoglycerate dehydrogenase-like enzyme